MTKQPNLTRGELFKMNACEAGERREIVLQGEMSIIHSSDHRLIEKSMALRHF